ncbi:hypothetical protein [Chloroflexus sp.]
MVTAIAIFFPATRSSITYFSGLTIFSPILNDLVTALCTWLEEQEREW